MKCKSKYTIFMQENALKNVVCKMSNFLSDQAYVYMNGNPLEVVFLYLVSMTMVPH